jgi:hypothetical protein
MRSRTVQERLRKFKALVLNRARVEGCGEVWRREAERLLESALTGRSAVGDWSHPVWPVLVEMYKREVGR